MSSRRPGRIIVLTAPSGGGKTSVARRLMEALPQIRFSVSATTRPPRAHEIDGKHYHFLSEEAFRSQVAERGLIEYEEVYPGRFYGTLKSAVDAATTAEPILLDIEVKGAENVKSLFGDEALTVFIMPPSMAVLAERLRNRGTESDEDVAVRLDRASMELEAAPKFDVVVVNDDLTRATNETIRAVESFLAGKPPPTVG